MAVNYPAGFSEPPSKTNDPPDRDDAPPNEDQTIGGPDGGDDSRRMAAYWKEQIDQTQEEYDRWEKRGRSIEKRYRDERNRVDEEGQRRYNLLWSNVQILQPALYGRTPTPVAERRFRDKDPVGRGAAQMLERALRNEIEINGYHEAIEQATLDYLLPGRGCVWVRYEPEIQEGVSIPVEGEMEMRDAQGAIEPEDDSDDEVKLRDTGDRIVRESVPIDYIAWADFLTFPAKARVWKEVVAIAKRVYMTRDQMIRKFGKKIGKAIPLEKDDRERRRQNESTLPEDEADRKGQVYEIWSRTDKCVYWVAEGYDFLCDRIDDPFKLDKFFPVPRPLYANPTTNTLVPVADYIQYQDQAVQIDELTQRISMLSKACKVAGLYNAASKDIQRLLDESVENELIPVDAWAANAEKGGVAGQISFLPLKEIIGVLNELMTVREKVMAEADRLTGISDVLRGTTDERETLGGSRLKSNSAGTRLTKRQADVARLCRDTVRLMAEIMSIHFSPRSLIEASGALYEEGLGDLDPAAFGPQGPSPTPPPPTQTPPQPGAPPTAGAGQPASPNQPAAETGPTPPPQAGVAPPQIGVPPPMPVDPVLQAKFAGIKKIMDAISLLRDQKLRGFRVDIEVDSTIFGDAAQEKQDRTEFLTAVTGFMEKSAQIIMQMPEAAGLMGKFLQFGVRGFRVGRDLETEIEDFCDEATDMAKKMAAQKASQPNPEQIKQQIEKDKGQVQIQTTQMKGQADQQRTQAEIQSTQMKSQAAQAEQASEAQRQQSESQAQMVDAQSAAQDKQADVQIRNTELEIEKIRLQGDLAKAEATRTKAMQPPPLPKGFV